MKDQFKKLTGQDWKPDLDLSKMSSVSVSVSHFNSTNFKHLDFYFNNFVFVLFKQQETTQVSSSTDSTNYVAIVLEKIKKVGDNVRTLKTNKASKVFYC